MLHKGLIVTWQKIMQRSFISLKHGRDVVLLLLGRDRQLMVDCVSIADASVVI